jgi:uncharacterized membrane protein YheB (UPF0754 family)
MSLIKRILSKIFDKDFFARTSGYFIIKKGKDDKLLEEIEKYKCNEHCQNLLKEIEKKYLNDIHEYHIR